MRRDCCRPQPVEHDSSLRNLAARNLATAGGGAANELDGTVKASFTERAKEMSSQFVFLKLFKDFPVVSHEIGRVCYGCHALPVPQTLSANADKMCVHLLPHA